MRSQRPASSQRRYSNSAALLPPSLFVRLCAFVPLCEKPLPSTRPAHRLPPFLHGAVAPMQARSVGNAGRGRPLSETPPGSTAVSRILFLHPPDGFDDHFSQKPHRRTDLIPAPPRGRGRLLPGSHCHAPKRAPVGSGNPSSLFCLAPHGVFPAPPLAERAVGSYPAFSPLPPPSRRAAVCSL